MPISHTGSLPPSMWDRGSSWCERSDCSFSHFLNRTQGNRMASPLCAFLCAWSASASRWTSCYIGHTGAAKILAWKELFVKTKTNKVDLIISSQLVSIALTQGASSRRGKVRCASDVPFHKCHNTIVSSQCEASGGQTHEKCFFCFSFTWWSSKVSLCLVEKSHPCSEQVNLFGWRWTYLR